MPDIDWGSGLSSAPATHCSHALIDAVQDCFLHQHITEPTRCRVGHEPHTLDLVMSNEEGMVQNIDFHPGLGHSDHIIITFDLECYTHHTEATGGAPNLHRANFDLLKHLIKSADWEMAVDKSVQKRYDHWKKTVNDLTNRCIPRAVSKTAKKNIYMTRKSLKLKKKKRSLWLTYVRTQDPIDYARYTRSVMIFAA